MRLEHPFDAENRLNELATEYAEAYSRAEPFPHVVIDDFMNPDCLDAVLDEFPSPAAKHWVKFDGTAQVKLGQDRQDLVGPSTLRLLHYFNSEPFIEFVEQLTGIAGLIPDPYFWGGGLHQIVPGGFLKLHTDFSLHPRMKVDRRVNVLIYLNKDWKEEYGGKLELWDKDITSCGQAILPIFNRFVAFNTTGSSYHGHPRPLTCPPNRTRKSIALYYYTSGRPEDDTTRTVQTNWRLTPDELRTGKVKRFVGRFVPPIVFEAKRATKRRFSGK